MANTIIGVGNDLEIKKQCVALAREIPRAMFWGTGNMGKGADTNMPIMQITDLEKNRGGQVTYQLRANLKMAPVYGDDRVTGRTGKLDFFTDTLKIEQVRQGVECGGKMAQQRTVYDLRKEGRLALTDYFSNLFDEYGMCYASGIRGSNDDYILPTGFTGFGDNTIAAPDSTHHKVSVVANATNTTITTLATGDIAAISEIDRLVTISNEMGNLTTGNSSMQPIMIEGGEHFLYVMSPRSESDIRTATGEAGWLMIQKYLASQLGNKSPLVQGGCGMHNNVVFKVSKKIPKLAASTSYNSVTMAALPGCRNLFLGRQALTYAYGSAGGATRYNWVEKLEDGDNIFVVIAGTIVGIKKTTFNGYDFGIIAHDCAAAAV